jgi:hypothetical protein
MKIKNWNKVDADEWKNTKSDVTIYINVTGPEPVKYGVIHVNEVDGHKELLYEHNNITNARNFAIKWMKENP